MSDNVPIIAAPRDVKAGEAVLLGGRLYEVAEDAKAGWLLYFIDGKLRLWARATRKR